MNRLRQGCHVASRILFVEVSLSATNPVSRHHLSRHVIGVAKRGCATGFAVGTSASAISPGAVGIIGTWAASRVPFNRQGDEFLFNLRVGFSGYALSARDDE